MPCWMFMNLVSLRCFVIHVPSPPECSLIPPFRYKIQMLLMDGFGCCRGRLLKSAPSVNRELSFQPDSQGIFLKWMDFPSLHGGSSGEAVSNVTACACERAFVCEASRKMLVRPHDTTDRSVSCATCESLELSRRFKMTLLCKLTKQALLPQDPVPPVPFFSKVSWMWGRGKDLNRRQMMSCLAAKYTWNKLLERFL